MKNITKSESESIVGEDANSVPIIDCPDVKPMPAVAGARMIGRQWYKCVECGNECLHEVNGKTYYHLLACSHSNGIAYGDERSAGAPVVRSNLSDGYTGVSKRALGKMMYELDAGGWTATAPGGGK